MRCPFQAHMNFRSRCLSCCCQSRCLESSWKSRPDGIHGTLLSDRLLGQLGPYPADLTLEGRHERLCEVDPAQLGQQSLDTSARTNGIEHRVLHVNADVNASVRAAARRHRSNELA